MAKASQRAPVLGPAFIRLLARLKDDAASHTAPDVSERLAQWFDWNRAITLSRALDNPPPEAPQGAAFSPAQDAECARTRSALSDAIHADIDLSPPRNAPPVETLAQAEFAPYRQHYLKRQRAMQTSTGNLRGRLRDMLARQSAAKARLAEVDAVMEATLSPREHALLSNVPALLGLHFERLYNSNTIPAPDADPSETPTAATGPWLATFRQDLRIALLAELDVRFHPIEGLLAALRTR
ncbi:DUF3348 domain-containing protein [Stenotrophomonas sp. SY1]|uniref:DUF3348 domain-containing protein n=1 Tax=Stenotrophomonas sp. SY1 TaxID=477235 RepID=UPI001E2E7674|nr:DUF3348 domain-containing protein [Stenotrophomonas sp. SY1]MCD9088496.1 DUF3348 domain-containing protein [Stenotrophomonas sp. SY1]